MLRINADVRRCQISNLGYPWQYMLTPPEAGEAG